MFRFMLLSSAAALATLAASQAQAQVQAQAQSSPTGQTSTRQDAFHDDAAAGIVVTAPFRRSQQDILSGTSVLTGQELTRELRPTIGETLQRQPGVSATSFGPNASRPVLRGLQGERVRVLTDGIGSFDASNTSVDHAVAINPLTADRIEVLRGPAALLFGSSAIGGVVNIVDSRIPRKVPAETVHVEALGTVGSAANERTGSAAVDLPVSDKIVLHVDGSYTNTDDLEIGGAVLAPGQRAMARASADPAVREIGNLKGRLPNSAAESWEVAGGAAIITGGSNVGFSVSHLENLYGVPIRYALEPGGEAEAVRIDLRQTRADLRGEVALDGGFLDQLRVRAGISDYRHSELGETGEVGTTFYNQGLEARLELVQANRGGWKGALGGQMFIRDLSAVGAEKFLPKNETQQFGVFTLQTFDFGTFKAEAGGRYEHSILAAAADGDLGNPNLRRTFDAFSGSIGASVGLGDLIRVGLNTTHSERAPSAEELFSNGPHAGTRAFEVGDPDFVKEKSNGLELTLKGAGEGYSFGLSGYYTWFSDFIFENPTGEIQSDLPVFQYGQANADLWGFEAEASAQLVRIGETAIVADGVADYTRATLRDGLGPVPRIPPLRLLGGLEAQAQDIQGRVEIEHVDSQDRIAAFETPTGSYTMVNASLAFRPFGQGNSTSLTISANNIFDVEARRHASFLKDFAPLAGRDIRVAARVAF